MVKKNADCYGIACKIQIKRKIKVCIEVKPVFYNYDSKGGLALETLKGKHVNNALIYVVAILLAAGGVVVSAGCSSNVQGKAARNSQEEAAEQEKAQVGSVTVYFANGEGYMVPITYPCKDSSSDLVRAAMEKLLEGPQTENLFRTIPQGTRLKDCYVSNETAFLDFTGDFNKLNNAKEATKAVKSLCLTLGSIQGIERVQLLVEGQPVEEIHGVSMGQIMEHSWVNYFGSGEDGIKYIVYFADKSAMYMVPVTYVSDTREGIPRKAVERLIQGPGTQSLLSTVWPGTKLLDLKIEEGIVYVDFSRDVIGYGGGTTAENLFVKSLLLTLGQFSDIQGIQILIDGKSTEYLPEGTQVAAPLLPIREANLCEKQ